MSAEAPGHRLAWRARQTLASYDANDAEILACIEHALIHFPDDSHLHLSKLACLRAAGRRQERLALLKSLCDRPDVDPVFWQQYAEELSVDARERESVSYLLQRALRYRPRHAGTYLDLAHLLWDQRHRQDALRVYRIAACLDDKDERLARSYFQASRHLRKTSQVIQFLRNRFCRFGRHSSQPARTLFWAYCQLEQLADAFAVLKAAVKLRPEDGELLLFAAQQYGNRGDFPRAVVLLKAARDKVPAASLHRTAANLSELQGDRPRALGSWQDVLALEPLALDAHRAVARLSAETHSRAAALQHLQRICTRFPHHYALHRLWIEWLRDDGPAALEPVLRSMITFHPADAWARRELALNLGAQGYLESAFAELDAAYKFDPTNPHHYACRGRLCVRAGKVEEAHQAFRQAIYLSVDCEPAISDWVASCPSQAEKREALAFITQELVRQVSLGNGLMKFRDTAREALDPDELLGTLEKIWQARPDVWHAWSALIRQRVDLERLDDALLLAREATARFPLQPRLWLDLALVCQAGMDQRGEIEALQQAIRIDPSWGIPIRQLVAVQERLGHLSQARTLLEQAVARTPLDAANHGALAELLWKMGAKPAALSQVQKALRLDPDDAWAWKSLRDWASALHCPAVATEFARELTNRRGGEARSWLMLARMLTRPSDKAERLAALDRALALNPRQVDACDLKAEWLARDRRFEEALDTCLNKSWGRQVPFVLRGRAAWIEAERARIPEAIVRMRALLTEDPHYVWGWQQLADWYHRQGNANGFLEAAEALVRIAPQNPVAHGYLGKARLQQQDRAGAKAALRKALELAADYGLAANLLFDEQLQDREWDHAAETLDLLKLHHPDEFTLAREVLLAARQRDHATACRCLKQLCLQPSEASWPLETATQAMVEAGWTDSLKQVLHQASESAQVHPLALFLCVEHWFEHEVDEHALPAATEIEEHLALLDRVLALRPHEVRTLELKAVILSRARRYDEGLAPCQTRGEDGEIPIRLRGRAAWIEAQRERLPEAIAQMRQVLSEDPLFYWGWQQLADWYAATHADDELLTVAEKLVDLAPNDPVPYGYLGEAYLRKADRGAARESFHRALELDPAYLRAGLGLFDEYLIEADFAAAEQLLENLLRQSSNASVLFRAIQLAVKMGDLDTALNRLNRLLTTSETHAELIDRVTTILKEAGGDEQVDQVLDRVLASPDVHPHVGSLWVQRRLRHGEPDWNSIMKCLDELVGRGEVGRHALIRYTDHLAERKRRKELRRCVQRYREFLRQCTWSWSRIGSALGIAEDHVESVRWLNDWERRPEVDSRTLLAHALHLRTLGWDAEANRVHGQAVAHSGAVDTIACHQVWLALDEALSGNPPSARAHLATLDPAVLDPDHVYLHALLEAILLVQEANPSERTVAFDTARQRFEGTSVDQFRLDHREAILPTYRRAVRRLAQEVGGMRARMWSWWRCRHPNLPKQRDRT
jgi:tetratricopeptide (TPR) repeat protein